MPADHIKHLAESVLEISEKATPGPWGVLPSNNGNLAHVETQEGCVCVEQGFAVFSVPKKRIADADFAAHCRTSAPALAEAVLMLLRVAECAREVRDGLALGQTADLLARSGLTAALAGMEEKT